MTSACLLHNLVTQSYAYRNRDSAVGIATCYGLDDRGVGGRVPVGSRIFSSPCRPDRLWGPSNLLSTGYRGSFPGSKAAGCEADHSPPVLQLPAHAGSSLADFSPLKMEAIRSSETSVQSTTSTRRHTPEDGILHSHRREYLKFYIFNIALNIH
jgi:hypothetical protein